ncbi:hypothetical protein niasHS_014021 [Heterodera schachtii]|uniref:Uncharacterized protein n=1 Tax=Heterodera schachtii TaxID=97005 RepID=A0ABD2IHV9_HETSC
MSRLFVSLRVVFASAAYAASIKATKFSQFALPTHSFISVFPPSVGLDDVIFDAKVCTTTDVICLLLNTGHISQASPSSSAQKQRTTKRMDQNRLGDSAWVDTLAWLDRAEVGMKLALVNDRFNTLVDRQFMQRQWRFGEFHICEREGARRGGAEIMTSEDGINFITLPLPTTPMPCSVVGFQTLSIWYINADVINFLRRIRRLLAEDIALEFSTRHTEFRSWQVIARHVWPLLRDGISTLVCLRKCDLAMLRKHVSPTVLFDCPDLHRIHTQMVPECPSDAADAENTDPTCRELYTWIHSPRDYRQAPISVKLIKWRQTKWDEFTNNLYRSFAEAVVPVQFMVLSTLPFRFNHVAELANEITQERLTLTSRIRVDAAGAVQTIVMVLRSSVEFDDAQMQAWLSNAKINAAFHDNLVHIGFNDNEIGELPSPSADAESASRTRTNRSA